MLESHSLLSPLCASESEPQDSVLNEKLFLEWVSERQVTLFLSICLRELSPNTGITKSNWIGLFPWFLSFNKSWIQISSFWQELAECPCIYFLFSCQSSYMYTVKLYCFMSYLESIFSSDKREPLPL